MHQALAFGSSLVKQSTLYTDVIGSLMSSDGTGTESTNVNTLTLWELLAVIKFFISLHP
jgi:hypothetical protein